MPSRCKTGSLSYSPTPRKGRDKGREGNGRRQEESNKGRWKGKERSVREMGRMEEEGRARERTGKTVREESGGEGKRRTGQGKGKGEGREGYKKEAREKGTKEKKIT